MSGGETLPRMASKQPYPSQKKLILGRVVPARAVGPEPSPDGAAKSAEQTALSSTSFAA